MLSITASDKSLLDLKASSYIVYVEEGSSPSKIMKNLAFDVVNIEELLKQREFTGKASQLISVPFMRDKHIAYAVFVGLGKKTKKHIDIEQLRRATGRALKEAIRFKHVDVAIQLPSAALFGEDVWYVAEQISIIAHMTNYQFKDYITDELRRQSELETVVLSCGTATDKKAAVDGIKTGSCVGDAVNMARHWVDSPPSFLTPSYLGGQAKSIGKDHGLKVTVFDEAQVVNMGMGGLSGVSRGSEEDCCLIVMEYKAKKKSARTLAFVGKGITFDSGGLSLKPADSMETMKEDMSGAAAVIATMSVIAQLKPDINIIGLAAVAENLPSGKATKPGDILRFYNGKTAEVKNTDAEGRLVLADALSYAVKHYAPDAIIDLATLTGACAYALGPFFSGLMSQHDEFAAAVEQAADISGDRVWRLPLHDDYKPAIRSEVADICNIGSRSYRAGAITAAFFLQHFVGDTPWVHLDIAGTAFDVPDMPYYQRGATGVGVRLLTALAMNWK